MKTFHLTLALLVLTAAPSQSQSLSDAREILKAYHTIDPIPAADRKLRIVCWRSKDTPYPSDQAARLQRIMLDIQEFYADEMERLGFGRRTIQLDTDAEGKLILHQAVGTEPSTSYRRPDGQKIKSECWPLLKQAGLDPDRETVMIFTNLASWDDETKVFRHRSPYYAGGNARHGTAWQLDSPQLDTLHLEKQQPIIDDGEYGKISLGKHNSIFIGGIAHELGHALGLPHCMGSIHERASGTALMGAGNRTYRDERRGDGQGSFLSAVSALRLASHPQFSGSKKGLNLPNKAQFTDMKAIDKGDHFILSGSIKSALPVYAVVAYIDAAGHGDYDSRTTFTVPDANGDFQIECSDLPKHTEGEVRLVALLVNGGTNQWRGPYTVGKDGKVDISSIQLELQLQEFTHAWSKKEHTQAAAIADSLPLGRAKTLAQGIVSAKQKLIQTKQPQGIPCLLSTLQPTSETVGWGKPTYNYLPRANPLLRCAGNYFQTGIYAHSPAQHIYQLGEHSYQTLAGYCGVPTGAFGTVSFQILIDGQNRYQSKAVKPDQLKSFQVDISNAKQIRLIVSDPDNNKAGDWGVWFDARLE